MAVNYLAYGSNLCTRRLVARVGEVEALGRVALPGYELVFSKRGADGSGKCTLLQSAGREAWGVVYRLDHAARQVLDGIEGLGRGYDAAWWELGDHGRCYVYLANPEALDATLAPFDWYRRLVLEGAREHGFPAAYQQQIAAVAATPDPDPDRSRRQLAVFD